MKKDLRDHRSDIIAWVVTVICVTFFVNNFGWIIKDAILAFFILDLIIAFQFWTFFHDMLIPSQA